MDAWGVVRDVVVAVAAVGCGVMAGVFFAFSAFIMRALGRLPDLVGIAAMQAINRAAVSAALVPVMFGTAGLCVVAIVVGAMTWSWWLVVGGGLYLLGPIGLTITYHVPRNNRLILMDAGAPGAIAYWQHYVRSWTRWNHVRFGLALAAAVVLGAALVVG